MAKKTCNGFTFKAACESPFWRGMLAVAILAVGLYGLDLPVQAADEVPVPGVKPALGGAQSQSTPPAPSTSASASSGGILTGWTSAAESTEPLAPAQADLYRQIFSLQDEGLMAEAEKLIAGLQDQRLVGHALAQRYLHPQAYEASFEELRDWMGRYGDHPQAERIFALALKKKPADYKGPLATPSVKDEIAPQREPLVYPGKTYTSPIKRSKAQKQQIAALKSKVQSLLSGGNNKQAYKTLQAQAKLLDKAEYDILQAHIASAFLYAGDPKSAYVLARASVERSGQYAPLGGWVAGLVAWRAGAYDRAARYFEVTASSPYSSGWTGAAGAYWTARANMRAGNIKDISRWLRQAQKHPRTFYGLLATRALGQDFDFNWRIPTFTKVYYDVLAAVPAGRRAMALVDSGQQELAEAELLRINLPDPRVRMALLSYASFENLPTLALRLGSKKQGEGNDDYYDVAVYPSVPWKPYSGFKLDPALLFAIARQESQFNPRAQSPSGAVGLMQILPSTANAVIKGAAAKLTDPSYNLEVAQKYIQRLLKDPSVEGDVLSMLVAYNAGPGNLAKWKALWPDVTDPLLFIEVIPAAETRTYVERVLANYWIYSLHDKRPTRTLDAVAEGHPALYVLTDYTPAKG